MSHSADLTFEEFRAISFALQNQIDLLHRPEATNNLNEVGMRARAEILDSTESALLKISLAVGFFEKMKDVTQKDIEAFTKPKNDESNRY